MRHRESRLSRSISTTRSTMLGSMMDVPMNVIQIIERASRHHGSTEIVSARSHGEEAHRYTYAEAYQRVCQLGKALRALGLEPGDRVGTLAWNSHAHLEVYYATAGLGLVCHTLNPRFSAVDLEWIINHAEDQVLIVDIDFLPLVKDLLPRLETIRQVIVIDSQLAPAADRIPDALDYEALLATESSSSPDWATVDEHQPCGLCYTSGTTGMPKGVTYTHRSTTLHAYASSLPDSFALSAQDAVMPIVPMFHVNAWGLPYSLPLVGAKIVLPGRALDGESLFQLMEAEQVTMAAGVPTVWLGILEHLNQKSRTFSSLKRTVIGGSAAPESMIRTIESTHKVSVVHAWGMTEISPTGAVNTPTRALRQTDEELSLSLKKKQGRAIPGIDIRIEKADGTTLPWDGSSPGHLLVRGPWVVQQYTGGVVGARSDGWFDTGDIATVDTQGFIHIVDRSKDVIKSGGEWISSIALESTACEHPGVFEAAVIGLPHPKWMERPLLICVPRPNSSLSPRELRDFLAERLPKWWLPDAIELVDSLPHGATGKLLKTELRQQFSHYSLAPADNERTAGGVL
ncbi:long-chain fatty acid--CoA ligase [Marinobacter sp. DUT-3]|uniref:long-chain fatty acid--CoA ligase n=1 Tax=Marinobacter sp. DUT-3 TaxID=3412036 RepID=UPI003D165D3B